MNLLFFRRSAPVDDDAGEPVEQTRKRRDQLREGCLGLLECVKHLSLDYGEVGADELKASLDELGRVLRADERALDLPEAFGARQRQSSEYSRRLRKYLDEREVELKRIVSLLSTGMHSISDDNLEFNKSIQERGERLEKLSQLDDIRRMRQELQSEVGQLRETVRRKQTRDALRIDSLQREVDVLRSDVEQARSEALVDALTGAGNRLGFDQQLRLMIDRNSVEPNPFSLLLIDVDRFKQINDEHGHPIGDRVLMALVQNCREALRPTDFVARYGGDEFAVILPGASPRDALKKARRLCETQAKRRYSLDDKGWFSFGISVGACSFRVGDSEQTVVSRADQGLYEAKRAGRGRAAAV